MPQASSPPSIIAVRGLTKQVRDSTGTLTILHEIHFDLAPRESVAIVGAYGLRGGEVAIASTANPNSMCMPMSPSGRPLSVAKDGRRRPVLATKGARTSWRQVEVGSSEAAVKGVDMGSVTDASREGSSVGYDVRIMPWVADILSTRFAAGSNRRLPALTQRRRRSVGDRFRVGRRAIALVFRQQRSDVDSEPRQRRCRR